MTTEGRQLGGVGSRLLHENEYCRVWELDLAPGESSPIHRHDHDYVLVVLAGDRVAAVPEPDSGGKHGGFFEAEVQAPMVFEMDQGGIEAAKNVGEERYYEILVEIL